MCLPVARCCFPIAAFGGVLVQFDWPALTPALIEIRLFNSIDGLGVSSLDAGPSGNSRRCLLVAVQFTPTGALSAEVVHGGSFAA